ncbi:hypothetical protein VM1G_12024 [Cytospora mali]|uniref:Uncharacterized protein n=1 Tax=Cytospora mali TaxID=578113 RepID=A0A194VHQ6_CYTMA|nr:hypothetical protein VM1G_12024 [Valsa mali]
MSGILCKVHRLCPGLRMGGDQKDRINRFKRDFRLARHGHLISEAVQLQAGLGDVLDINQEVQRHLHQHAPDAGQLLLDLVDAAGELRLDDVAIHDLVRALALLVGGDLLELLALLLLLQPLLHLLLLVGAGDDEVLAEEVVVVLPRAHDVVGDVVEHLAEDLGVGPRRPAPQLVELVAQRVGHQHVGGGAPVVLVGPAGDGVEVAVGPVPPLVGQQAQVLAEELPAQGGGELGGGELLAAHGRAHGGRVLDDDGDLRVVRAQLRPVVQVRAADDGDPVVGDEHLGVDVQLLRHVGVYLRLGRALPRDRAQVRPGLHVRRRDGVPRLVRLPRRRLLVVAVLAAQPALGVLVARVAVVAGLDVVVELAARVVVLHARLVLRARHGRRDVQAVVVAQVVEGDVLVRVHDARLPELLDDRVPAPADGVVLELHDGPRAQRAVRLEVAREGGHGRHRHDDAELLVVLVRPHDPRDDGRADLVVDGLLLVVGGGDEELRPLLDKFQKKTKKHTTRLKSLNQRAGTYLVLDVNEVLGIVDDFNVSVGDGVLGGVARRPRAAAPAQLDMQTMVLLALPRAFLAPHAAKVLAEVALEAPEHLAGLVLALLEEATGGRGVGDSGLEDLVLGVVVGVVLLAEDVVPPVDEVDRQAVHDGAGQGDADVGPAHARVLGPVELVLLPLVDALEVVDTRVVVVLAGVDDGIHVSGVGVRDGVAVGVPAAEAGVETAHKGNLVVDQAQLLVVGPEKHDIVVGTVEGLQRVPRHLGQAEGAESQVLETGLELGGDVLAGRCVVRVAEHLDVLVESLKGMLGVLRVAGKRLGDLLVHDHIDLDTSLGGSLQHVVQTTPGPLKNEHGQYTVTSPPIDGFLLLTFKGLRKSPEVSATIDVPLGVTGRLGRKRLVAVSTVLAVDLMALGTLMGVRVLLLIGTEDASEARL